VRAVADDIEVRRPLYTSAGAAQIRNGRVILHGEVESAAQRDAAERAVRQLTGVRAVGNLIQVTPPIEPTAADVDDRGYNRLSPRLDADELIGDELSEAPVEREQRVTALELCSSTSFSCSRSPK
jgi:hypothetical protein